MLKKGIEKIRDDLYVRKGKWNTYSIVYPLKDKEGNKIKGNLKRALMSDVIGSIPTLVAVGILLMMLLPGAQQIKVQCEEAIEYLQENACEVCTANQLGDRRYDIPFIIENGSLGVEGNAG